MPLTKKNVKYFTILNKQQNHVKPCPTMGLHGSKFLKACHDMVLDDSKVKKAQFSAITGLRYKTS